MAGGREREASAAHRGSAAVACLAGVALVCCVAFGGGHQTAWGMGSGEVELESRGGNPRCDRLCQARNVILKAKAALDRRANMEIDILQVGFSFSTTCGSGCPLSLFFLR